MPTNAKKSGKDANLSENIWKTGWTYIRNVVDTVREPFIILNEKLIVLTANENFYRTFDTNPDETENKFIYLLGNGQWGGKHLRNLLDNILPKHTFFKDYEVDQEFPEVGRKIFLLNARRVYDDSNQFPNLIILAMEDVTKQRMIEARLSAYAKELETKVNERTEELTRRIEQLERVNQLMISREQKLEQLQNENAKLKKLLDNKK